MNIGRVLGDETLYERGHSQKTSSLCLKIEWNKHLKLIFTFKSTDLFSKVSLTGAPNPKKPVKRKCRHAIDILSSLYTLNEGLLSQTVNIYVFLQTQLK